MARAVGCLVVLLALAAPGSGAGEPAWVSKVPDFRASWPEPLPIGSAAPDFTLPDLATDRPLKLSKARAGKKAAVLLFVDDSCGTAKKRAADLAATLTSCTKIEGTAVLVVFPRNLSGRGAKGMSAFAEESKFPAVPLLRDDADERAGVTIAYRVPVTPCAVVLDGEGRIAYFGLALAPTGADLLPGLVAAVAAGKPIDGAAVRPPYG